VEKVIVKDGTLIGINSTILTNVTIGKGFIVSAGSVVVHDVEPYTIVASNPVKKNWFAS